MSRLGWAGTVYALSLLAARPVCSQVPVVLPFAGALAETVVGNAGRERSSVTVALWRSLSDTLPPSALVAPRAFDLGPGDRQTVRVLLREPCNPTWRWATTFLPADSGQVVAHQGLATVRLRTATRLVGRVECKSNQ